MCCIGLILLMTGCEKYSRNGGYYSNLTATGGTDDYSLSGKAYVTDTLSFLHITSSENTEISLKGELKKISGNIDIVYVGENGESIITSSKDKNAKIDAKFQVESGDGRLEFRGSNVSFNFNITIENIEKVEYIGIENKKEEELKDNEPTDTDLNLETQSKILQEITATYTDSDNDCVVLDTEISEDTKINVSVKASVSNAEHDKNVFFNGFELVYNTEGGKSFEVMKCDEKAFALGGYEWEDDFNIEMKLPKGINKLIFRSKDGNNYKIKLDICVSEVE